MSQFILFSCNKKKSGLHDINPEFSLRKVVIVILELPFVIFLFHGGNKNTELRWKLTIQRKKSELHNINSELLDVNNSDFFLTIMKKTIMKKKIMKKIKKNIFYIFKYFFHFLIHANAIENNWYYENKSQLPKIFLLLFIVFILLHSVHNV